MPGRRVRSSHEFDHQVEALGGYEKLDPVLNPVVDGLYIDPYGYNIIQHDLIPLCRYARTIPQDDGSLPAFIILFVIEEDGGVELREIWPDEDY
jgi:hypothetical protein